MNCYPSYHFLLVLVLVLLVLNNNFMIIRSFQPRCAISAVRHTWKAVSVSRSSSSKVPNIYQPPRQQRSLAFFSERSPRSSSSSSPSLSQASAPDLLSTTRNTPSLQQLQSVAETAARAAGEVIRNHLGCVNRNNVSKTSTQQKTNIKDVVTQHDTEAQDIIHSIIRQHYPQHSFLGEEDVAPGAASSETALQQILQQTKEKDKDNYVWITDPIDGTANFASGLSFCATTIAVVHKGSTVVGVVYDPHTDEMFTAIRGQGAFLKTNKQDEPQRLQVQSVTSMEEAIVNAGCPADPNAFAASLRGIQALNSQTRGIHMIACSALTTAWVAAGRLTAHFGYDLSSWDLAAGALLIQEAGGLVTDLDGTDYRLETRNMLCSCDGGDVHEQILLLLKDADAASFERA